jgi:hypothetical protein
MIVEADECCCSVFALAVNSVHFRDRFDWLCRLNNHRELARKSLETESLTLTSPYNRFCN